MKTTIEKKLINKPLLFAVLSLFIAFVLSTVVLCERIITVFDPTPSAIVSIARNTAVKTTNTEQNGVTVESYGARTEDTVSAIKVTSGNMVWKTMTEVNIFKISYENGEKKITVIGGDSDEVIAPGTDNKFKFKIQNDADFNIDYLVTAEAFYSDSEKPIPINVRFSDEKGIYFLGTETGMLPVMELNKLNFKRTLSSRSYLNYFLEWEWPFESGNDEYDTFLGNEAVDEDVTLTIVLSVLASQNTNPNINEGNKFEDISRPITGETFNIIVWGTISLISFVILIIVIVYIYKRRWNEDGEKNRQEE